jgi:archaetidylinositol phosphate synthase
LRGNDLLTKLKQRFQFWIASEAEFTHNIGLTPNHVSAVGMLFAISSALAYWNWQLHQILLVVAPISLLISGFCDALDGALARIYGETTIFGGFLDSLLDRYADAFVLCGIILGGLCHPFWGLTALTGSLLVSYVRARAEAKGVKMEAVGITERAERILIIVITSFLSVVWLEALSWGVIVLAVLANLTVLQRVIHFYKTSQQKEK